MNSVPDTSASGRPVGSKSDAAERDLVARLSTGDMAAFTAVFKEHYAALCGFILSYVQDAGVAEELVQDLFCALWRRREEWEPEGPIRNYLLAAARNRAISHLRHRRMATHKAREWAGPAGGDERPPGMGRPIATPDRDLELRELSEACRRAIHQLPERRRLVLTLRWQHQMSHAEIARLLGISVKGVEIHLTRALKSLRKLLDQFHE